MYVYTYMYAFYVCICIYIYILHVYAIEGWPSRAIEVLETFIYYNQLG